jgi:exosortase
VLGVRASVFALQGWSILPMLFGLTLAFLGPAFARALAFPIGYLVFMLTFPSFVTNQLSFALKAITLKLSVVAAEALGVSLQRVGMTVFLETGELRIENPCSGLRSLLALLALGALFAHLQPGGLARRLLLFALAIPIALLGNAFRTTLLLVAGHYVNVEFAAGRFHDLSGYVVYAVALVLLFAARALLRPRAPAAPGDSAPAAEGAG